MKLEPIDKKIEAFGFNVHNCDGHDINEILNKLDYIKNSSNPSCLIANTVKEKELVLWKINLSGIIGIP